MSRHRLPRSAALAGISFLTLLASPARSSEDDPIGGLQIEPIITSLSAALVPGTRTVHLEWSRHPVVVRGPDGTDPPDPPAILRYDAYFRAPGGMNIPIDNPPAPAGVGVLQTLDTDIPASNGGPYAFWIDVILAGGNHQNSNVATAAIPDNVAPEPLTSLQPASATPHAITLRWNSAPAGATELDVEYGTDPAALSFESGWQPVDPAPAGPENNRLTITSLVPSTPYFFRSRVRDAALNVSNASAVFSQSTAGGYGDWSPTTVTALQVSVNHQPQYDWITLRSTAPYEDGGAAGPGRGGAVTEYVVRYRRAGEGFTFSDDTWDLPSTSLPGLPTPEPGEPGTAATFSFPVFPDAGIYFFAVRSNDADGNQSEVSVTSSIVLADRRAPPPMTGLRVLSGSVGTTEATVSWDAPGEDSDAVDARIYIATSLDTHDLEPASPWIPVGTRMTTISGLSPDLRYYVRSRLRDAAHNETGWSAAVALSTQADPLEPLPLYPEGSDPGRVAGPCSTSGASSGGPILFIAGIVAILSRRRTALAACLIAAASPALQAQDEDPPPPPPPTILPFGTDTGTSRITDAHITILFSYTAPVEAPDLVPTHFTIQFLPEPVGQTPAWDGAHGLLAWLREYDPASQWDFPMAAPFVEDRDYLVRARSEIRDVDGTLIASSPYTAARSFHTIDRTAPGALTAVHADQEDLTSVRLNWTLAGENGAADPFVGAAEVEIRSFLLEHPDADDPDSDEAAGRAALVQSFAPGGVQVNLVPMGGRAVGAVETVTLSGLAPERSYLFVLRCRDEERRHVPSNWSPFSPVLRVDLPDTVAPDAIQDLMVVSIARTYVVLEWTTTGDNRGQGRADHYDFRMLPSMPADPWAAFPLATPLPGAPRPAEPGHRQRFTVEGLALDTDYVFLARTADEVGNGSGVSNAVLVRTGEEFNDVIRKHPCNLATGASAAWPAAVLLALLLLPRSPGFFP